MKKIANNIIIVIMMGLVPAMTSCQGLIDAVVGSEDKPTTTQNVVHISDITIVGEGIVNGELSLKVGDKHQLATTFTPAETTETEVNWKSSDESVITVSSTGLLTAVKAGSATVTVTSAVNATVSSSINIVVSDGELNISDDPVDQSKAETRG